MAATQLAIVQTPEVEARADDSVIIPEDGAREASIGEVAKMPTLREALAAWAEQVSAEKPTDLPTAFGKLALKANGRLSRGNGGMRMTYRVFGNILRRYCLAPRNVARVLHTLPTAEGDAAHEAAHSPRACAYNAYLARGKHLVEEQVVLRTRELPHGDARTPVIVGSVTPSHSGAAGDDPVFIAALREGFGRHSAMVDGAGLDAIRARYFRGVEVSELRAVIPAMRVEMAPGEWWSGYITVRNSEVGAASWSVAAGLHKEMDEVTAEAAKRLGFDGATLTIEANSRLGMHAGKRVGGRVQEALVDANTLLVTLAKDASELAAKASGKTAEWVASRLATAIRRTGAGEELTDSLLSALALVAVEWERLPARVGGRIPAHAVVTFLGQAMKALPRRAQTYPLERLAGRVLLNGIDAALEKLAEYNNDVDVEE